MIREKRKRGEYDPLPVPAAAAVVINHRNSFETFIPFRLTLFLLTVRDFIYIYIYSVLITRVIINIFFIRIFFALARFRVREIIAR